MKEGRIRNQQREINGTNKLSLRFISDETERE
jgi:hypothetical protein